MPRFDILSYGCATVDDLLYVERYPEADAKVRVERSERCCGGLSASALVAAARLGARCLYAGPLGEDALSTLVCESLQSAGVTVHSVPLPSSLIHATIVVDVTAQTRNIFFELQGEPGPTPEVIDPNTVAEARVLYVDHYGIPGTLRAMEMAASGDTEVVADLERENGPLFPQLLDAIGHLVLSRRFALQVTGTTMVQSALRKLWHDGRRAVVITGGSDGCWALGADDPDSVLHQPAFPVEVVDTTGCGDVFHGAYAAGVAWGWDLATRLRFASAAAACKATRHGAQSGPTMEEVKTLL